MVAGEWWSPCVCKASSRINANALSHYIIITIYPSKDISTMVLSGTAELISRYSEQCWSGAPSSPYPNDDKTLVWPCCF